MRKIVVSMFLTLDGIMEAPNKWSFPFWIDHIAKFKFDALFASSCVFLQDSALLRKYATHIACIPNTLRGAPHEPKMGVLHNGCNSHN